MQQYGKKVIEKLIDWAVPVICAGALLLWQEIPDNVQHYWPVMCMGVMGLFSLCISIQNRQDVRKLRSIHEQADLKAEETREKYDLFSKAFRASLDDDMGKLYAICVEKGYTTEDERRRYDRLQKAYEGVGGNGEAKRRKLHFETIMYEEEWRAAHCSQK